MIAVVVPALDEEATIGEVVERVKRFGSVIVVDDGSTDRTADIARGAGAIVVRHDANRGYDAALASGFRRAREVGADAVVSVDADGEHILDALEDALARVAAGEVAVALGVRSAGARFSERLFSAYTSRRFGLSDVLCGVKVYAADLLAKHDAMLDRPTIGTGVALAALADGVPYITFPVPIRVRATSRFGRGIRPNLKILRAMALAVAHDARATFQRRMGRSGRAGARR